MALVEMASAQEAGILQNFWGLSSLDGKEREDAARELLTTLTSKQHGCEEGEMSGDLDYTIQRLVRGLASGRKAARHGFFVTLIELLSMFSEVKVAEILKLMNTFLKPHGSMKGAEEKGVYFGRLFTLLALSQSGRLTSKAEILEVASQLCTIATRKPFLNEVCTVAVGNLAEDCHSDGEGVMEEIVKAAGMGEGWEQCSPERLYLLLKMRAVSGEASWWKQLVREGWSAGKKRLFSVNNLTSLVEVLEESCSAHPRLHSVWPYVLERVRHTSNLLPEFWTKMVEGSLVQSTHKKRLMALKILESILPDITVNEVAVVFSPNLLRCILNNASSPSNYLYSPTRELLASISTGSRPTDVQVCIWMHLQFRSIGNFDQLTKTSTMKDLVAKLDSEGTGHLIQKLLEAFHTPELLTASIESDDPLSGPHTVQTWVVDQLLSLVRNRAIEKTSSSLLDVAKFLLLHAYYGDTALGAGVHIAVVEPAVQKLCSVRLTGVLAELCTLIPQGRSHDDKGEKAVTEGREGDKRRAPGTMEGNGQLYLVALLEYAQQLPSQPFEEEAMVAWQYVQSVMGELGRRDGELQLEEKAFLLLFAAVGLQLLAEPATTTETVEELRQCYSDMKSQLQQQTIKQTKTPKKKPPTSPALSDSEAAPSWVEVATDILLGYLSQSSQLWRSVVEQVFRRLVHRVTPGVVQLIAKVLEPQTKEELMEDDEEEEDEEESGSEAEGEGDGEGEGEGEGEGDGEGEGEGEGGKDETTGDEEDSDMEEGSEGEEAAEGEVDEKFRADVMRALGNAAAQSDDESDVSMHEEEMERVDKALAAIFRSQLSGRSSKKQKKDEAKSIVHFKLRVLDLVQIILQRQHSNPAILDLVLPLYRMIRSANNKPDHAPLVSRAVPMFRNKLCVAKKLPRQHVDIDHTHSLIEKLVQCLYKEANQDSVQILNEGIVFILKVLLACEPAPPPVSPLTTRAGRKRRREGGREGDGPVTYGLLNVPLVTGWLSNALHDFITKKNSSIHHQIFFVYIERLPALSWQLVGRITEDLPSPGNHFRKVQAFEILAQIFSAKIEDKVFLDCGLPHVPALVTHCCTELSNCLKKPDKQAKPVLKLVLKLASKLKEHKQLDTSLQESLISALHPLHAVLEEGGRGVEVVMRECERVMSVLEGGEEEEGEGEGGSGRAKHRKKNRHRKKRENLK